MYSYHTKKLYTIQYPILRIFKGTVGRENGTYELSVYHWKIPPNCDRIYPKFDNKAVKYRGGMKNGI